MEAMGQPYDAVMAMPSGRRRRFCDEKENLDKYRARRQRSAAKSKSRGRW